MKQHGEKRENNADEESWLRAWLLSDAPAPELESFDIKVWEETDAHAILNNVSNDVHIRLKKRLEEFPGLVLRPSKYRLYPFGDVACHVIGRLSAVTAEDLKADPNRGDELREYLPNDQIGRAGVEALADQALRGARGRIERMLGDDRIVGTVNPAPGQDVVVTIDVELQRMIEDAFRDMRWTGRRS
jgi:penicillin-binding protein 2